MEGRGRTGFHAVDLEIAAFLFVVVLGRRYGAAGLRILVAVHALIVEGSFLSPTSLCPCCVIVALYLTVVGVARDLWSIGNVLNV